MRTAIVIAAGVMLASCRTSPAEPQSGGDAVMPAGDATSPDCPVTTSTDWAAWINAMPGPGRSPNLVVTGKVTVPTGGYAFSFGDPIVAESNPVQVTVALNATPTASSATPSAATQAVRGSWPMKGSVGSVTVKCGSKVLTRISPVETTY